MRAKESKTFGERLPKTAALLDEAVDVGVFPVYAASVALLDANNSTATRLTTYRGCGAGSLFDLASLTKVLCTTTLFAMAEARGLLSSETPVQMSFPAFTDRAVTLRHLLSHTSGLPAWLPLHDAFHGPWAPPERAREYFEKAILASHDPQARDRNATYSDLGFMLLGWAIEKALSVELDALFQEWIALPLEVRSLQFLPASPDVVPTENCPWRGRVLRGEVHDENCYVLGGIAGHAGLFGNLTDVSRLGELWLETSLDSKQSFRPRERLFSQEIALRYWTKQPPSSNVRALGWDGVSPGQSSSGTYFSPNSRGHLGYTGTSLWIDPVRRLVVTLLTNRVFPSRANEKIREFRPLFHDTLLSELGVVGT